MASARTWTFGKLLTAAALLAAFAALLWLFAYFVMVGMLALRNPDSSAFMDATLAELRQTNPRAQLQHEWVSSARISDAMKRAVIASEDANFSSHAGVEWGAIQRAWKYNQRQAARGGRQLRGGSTITQQLAKNLFLSGSRSYWRKGQELVLAYMLEALLSKERILELYLNLAQWGKDVFGVQAAARHYFRVDAMRLSAEQSARLAAMLPNPRYYDEQGGNTAYLRQRARELMQFMKAVQLPGDGR